MKAAYPGGNAEHITAQQAALAEAWQDLQDATVYRRDMLKAAYDLQRFNVKVSSMFPARSLHMYRLKQILEQNLM